jgi:membrane protein
MSFRAAWLVVKEAVLEFFAHDVWTHAAGIAFYTALGLAPTVLVFLAIAGLLGGVGEQSLINEMRTLFGDEAAEGIELVIENADREKDMRRAGAVSTVISVATFVISASGVFAQLQYALNMVWNVMPRPGAGVRDWLRSRLISLGMVLAMLVLILASLVASAVVAAAIPAPGAWRILHGAASLMLFTLSFGLIFKFLPDVKIAWRDVIAGALMTAVLFTLGKWAIGLYLGNSTVGSAYGMAGSLIVLLVWVYYSSIIILFGAQMTQVYARRFGRGIRPDRYAVRVEPAHPVEESSRPG